MLDGEALQTMFGAHFSNTSSRTTLHHYYRILLYMLLCYIVLDTWLHGEASLPRSAHLLSS